MLWQTSFSLWQDSNRGCKPFCLNSLAHLEHEQLLGSLWSWYSASERLSGWCFLVRPWTPGNWGPTSHVMLDDDLEASEFPSLLLSLFTSGRIQHEVTHQEPCSGLGLFWSAFHSLMIYPISSRKKTTEKHVSPCRKSASINFAETFCSVVFKTSARNFHIYFWVWG